MQADLVPGIVNSAVQVVKILVPGVGKLIHGSSMKYLLH